MSFPDPAPSLALHHHPQRPMSFTVAPRHFILRSLKNIKQGNITLFVVFCGCLIIFLRALAGVGYDEALSAAADARLQKHPSLLARWGPQSQQKLEEQWARLRKSSGQGLFAKFKKEDAVAGSLASHNLFAGSRSEEAFKWLRGIEGKALGGLGRRQSQQDNVLKRVEGAVPDPSPREEPFVVQPPLRLDDSRVQAPVVIPQRKKPKVEDPVVAIPAETSPLLPPEPTITVVAPEHDISEDLDEHDAPEEDEGSKLIHLAPARDAHPARVVASVEEVPAEAAPPDDSPRSNSDGDQPPAPQVGEEHLIPLAERAAL